MSPGPEFRLTRKIADAQLLAAAAFVLPTMGFLAPLGIAPLLAVVALALIALAPRSRLDQVKPFRPLAVMLATLSLWGALSALWSTIPGHSLFEGGRLALISASGIVVAAAALDFDGPDAARLGRAGIAGLVLGIVIALIELYGDFPLRRLFSAVADRSYYHSVLDRGAVVLTLTAWFSIRHLILRRLHVGAGLILIATVLTVAQLASLAALLGLIIAIAAFAVAWWWPRIVAGVFALGFAALSLAMPLTHPSRDFILWLNDTMPWLRASGIHRLIIWRFASDRAAERPILGWGMDAARELPGGNAEIHKYMHLPEAVFNHLNGSVMPLHPHDAILQWRLELGILGALLGLAIFAWTVSRVPSWPASPRVLRATGLAVIAAALPPLLLDFGVWQAWWQSTLWFAAALVLAVGEPAKPTRPSA
jgi:O-antigen ligase